MRMGAWQRTVVVLGVLVLVMGTVACAADDGNETPGPDVLADTEAPGTDVGDDTTVPTEDAAPDAGADVAPDVEEDVPPRPTGPYEVPSGPVDMTFRAGPYLGTTTTTAVVVSWVTEESGDSVVEFGLDAEYGGLAEGEPDATIHEVTVDGLEPETLYHYRACTGDTCTGDLTFATAPLPDRGFRFAVYSDTQTNTEVHAEVAESMRQSLPALVLLSGDVVGWGADRESYETEYLEPARRRNHYVPAYLAVGNHDWKDQASQVQNFRDYFAFPKDPDVPLQEASYSLTYGNAFFIALDNTMDGGHFFFPLGGSEDPPLWNWLVAQATSEAAQSARWRFAFFHYPAASACQEDWPNMVATREKVLPLLRENGFQAVFSGHTHEYEHQIHDGIHAFINGGGAGGIETDESCTFDIPQLVYRQALHHHLTVDLGDEQATVRAVATDGSVVDTVLIDRVPAD